MPKLLLSKERAPTGNAVKIQHYIIVYNVVLGFAYSCFNPIFLGIIFVLIESIKSMFAKHCNEADFNIPIHYCINWVNFIWRP